MLVHLLGCDLGFAHEQKRQEGSGGAVSSNMLTVILKHDLSKGQGLPQRIRIPCTVKSRMTPFARPFLLRVKECRGGAKRAVWGRMGSYWWLTKPDTTQTRE